MIEQPGTLGINIVSKKPCQKNRLHIRITFA